MKWLIRLLKGAQIAFVKALSKEVALNGIRVNAIAPGAIETPMMDQFYTRREWTDFLIEIPMGRLGHPEEIANGVSLSCYQMSLPILLDKSLR